MDDEQAIARGHRAFNELNEVNAAFDEVEAAILRTLGETPIGQDAKVLKLHMAVQNLAAVKQTLQEMIDNGLMAQAALSQAGLTRPN